MAVRGVQDVCGLPIFRDEANSDWSIYSTKEMRWPTSQAALHNSLCDDVASFARASDYISEIRLGHSASPGPIQRWEPCPVVPSLSLRSMASYWMMWYSGVFLGVLSVPGKSPASRANDCCHGRRQYSIWLNVDSKVFSMEAIHTGGRYQALHMNNTRDKILHSSSRTQKHVEGSYWMRKKNVVIWICLNVFQPNVSR